MGFNQYQIRDSDIVTHSELGARRQTDEIPSHNSFPLTVSSSDGTNDTITVSENIDHISIQAGDKVLVSGGAAEGFYTVASVSGSTISVQEQVPGGATSGSVTIFHPAGSVRIGVDNTEFSNLTGVNLQEVLDNLDTTLGTFASSGHTHNTSELNNDAGFLDNFPVYHNGGSPVGVAEGLNFIDGTNVSMSVVIDGNGFAGITINSDGSSLPTGGSGHIIYHNGTDWTTLGPGDSNQYLRGGGTNLGWYQVKASHLDDDIAILSSLSSTATLPSNPVDGQLAVLVDGSTNDGPGGVLCRYDAGVQKWAPVEAMPWPNTGNPPSGGSMMYYTGSVWSTINGGNNGEVLTLNGSVPDWQPASAPHTINGYGFFSYEPGQGYLSGGSSLGEYYGPRIVMPDGQYSYWYHSPPPLENWTGDVAYIYVDIYFSINSTPNVGDDVYLGTYTRSTNVGSPVTNGGYADYEVVPVDSYGANDLVKATVLVNSYSYDPTYDWHYLYIRRLGSSSTDSYAGSISIRRVDIRYDGYWLGQ